MPARTASPGGMTESVIECLECVQVDHCHRQGRTLASGPRDLAFEDQVDALAVRQPGQGVGHGDAPQLESNSPDDDSYSRCRRHEQQPLRGSGAVVVQTQDEAKGYGGDDQDGYGEKAGEEAEGVHGHRHIERRRSDDHGAAPAHDQDDAADDDPGHKQRRQGPARCTPAESTDDRRDDERNGGTCRDGFILEVRAVGHQDDKDHDRARPGKQSGE